MSYYSSQNEQIEIIIDHFKDQKWFADAVIAKKEERILRQKRAEAIGARSKEWEGMRPPEQEKVIAKIRDEVLKEVQ